MEGSSTEGFFTEGSSTGGSFSTAGFFAVGLFAVDALAAVFLALEDFFLTGSFSTALGGFSIGSFSLIGSSTAAVADFSVTNGFSTLGSSPVVLHSITATFSVDTELVSCSCSWLVLAGAIWAGRVIFRLARRCFGGIRFVSISISVS